MTNDKAREFFSAYAEGTLDAGLQQSFEQRLRSSSELQEEYRDFEQTLDELGALKFEYIEVPADLHERISARLDRHVYDQKQAATPAWRGWARNVGYATLAAAAVVGAVIGLNSRGGPNTSSQLPLPITNGDQLTVKSAEGSVLLNYTPAAKHDVTVSSATTGEVLRRVAVGTAGWSNSLENKQPEAALFEVAISGDSLRTFIAVPGQAPHLTKTGQGTLKEFVRTLAGFYHTPVVLKSAHPDQTVTWNLTLSAADEAASNVLGSQRFSVEDRPSGVLWIQEQ